MTWTYTGNPLVHDRDKIRFIIGDTDVSDSLVSDEEIAYAINEQTDLTLAAAFLLRALAAKFSRLINCSIGGISSSGSAIAQAFVTRANELDPAHMTVTNILVLPTFGGISVSGNEALDQDLNAEPMPFSIGMDDNPSVLVSNSQGNLVNT